MFAATAIAVLWACSLRQTHAAGPRRQAVVSLAVKVVLIAGEVAAVVTLGRNHETRVGAWLCAGALIGGGTVVAAPAVSRDLSRLGMRSSVPSVVSGLVVLGVGWLGLLLS